MQCEIAGTEMGNVAACKVMGLAYWPRNSTGGLGMEMGRITLLLLCLRAKRPCVEVLGWWCSFIFCKGVCAAMRRVE